MDEFVEENKANSELICDIAWATLKFVQVIFDKRHKKCDFRIIVGTLNFRLFKLVLLFMKLVFLLKLWLSFHLLLRKGTSFYNL